MSVGVLITDMVGFVHDHKIKTRGRVQIQKPRSRLFLGTVQKRLVKQRIRENCFPMWVGPFSLQMHLIYAIPQRAPVQMAAASLAKPQTGGL